MTVPNLNDPAQRRDENGNYTFVILWPPHGSAHHNEGRIDLRRKLNELYGDDFCDATEPEGHKEELERERELYADGGMEALREYWREKGILGEKSDAE